MLRIFASFLVLLLAIPLAAIAQGATDPATPQRIGGGKHWDAFSYSEKGAKVCYLVGRPEKSEPANVKRGRIDAIVTHRPKEKSLNVVNFDLGYALKPGADADLDIDGHKFALFTDKDAAWAQDAATDKAVTEALAKGKRATLKASSARGTATSDLYALDGFKEALAAIDKACGVKR
jgi:invasion protein IalB